ncbi:hypothetical protein Patl1_10949 [Pistacia atlantica]|uniref:Uncharacterized protein n=1 Tax=Pistacia atlantica TaxID=434234 RepID=A0ACC1A5T8_9ROSI|nr:hypothetical protein Patl1_10949 [Pistacia atlantica]
MEDEAEIYDGIRAQFPLAFGKQSKPQTSLEKVHDATRRSEQPPSTTTTTTNTQVFVLKRKLFVSCKGFDLWNVTICEIVESCLLKEVRSRLASQEQSFVKENLTRQEAETKAKNMEEEICRLQKTLEERNGQLEASASNTEKPDVERDQTIMEIEQECLAVYGRKIDEAKASRAQLQRAIALSESEIASICSSLGESNL